MEATNRAKIRKGVDAVDAWAAFKQQSNENLRKHREQSLAENKMRREKRRVLRATRCNVAAANTDEFRPKQDMHENAMHRRQKAAERKLQDLAERWCKDSENKAYVNIGKSKTARGKPKNKKFSRSQSARGTRKSVCADRSRAFEHQHESQQTNRHAEQYQSEYFSSEYYGAKPETDSQEEKGRGEDEGTKKSPPCPQPPPQAEKKVRKGGRNSSKWQQTNVQRKRRQRQHSQGTTGQQADDRSDSNDSKQRNSNSSDTKTDPNSKHNSREPDNGNAKAAKDRAEYLRWCQEQMKKRADAQAKTTSQSTTNTQARKPYCMKQAIKDAVDSYSKRWQQFEKKEAEPGSFNYRIDFDDVPWIPEPPPGCDTQRILLAAIGLHTISSSSRRGECKPCPSAHSMAEQKAACRKAVLRWHPDKFTQAYAARLHPKCRDRVMTEVKATMQRLTALKSDLGL